MYSCTIMTQVTCKLNSSRLVRRKEESEHATHTHTTETQRNILHTHTHINTQQNSINRVGGKERERELTVNINTQQNSINRVGGKERERELTVKYRETHTVLLTYLPLCHPHHCDW